MSEVLLSGGTINNDVTISSSGKYSNINLGNSETVIISGDVTLIYYRRYTALIIRFK